VQKNSAYNANNAKASQRHYPEILVSRATHAKGYQSGRQYQEDNQLMKEFLIQQGGRQRRPGNQKHR
jgi:hypothetical protein